MKTCQNLWDNSKNSIKREIYSIMLVQKMEDLILKMHLKDLEIQKWTQSIEK